MSRSLSFFNTPLKFILSLTALRILWHMLSPVGMAGDESYYWLWGQHWDWGYYSKPPFIGWFFGIADNIPVPKTWLFKSCAALFSAGALYYLHKCFLQVTGNEKLAWYGLLAFGLSPANLLFSSLLTIDSPLMFFWAGGMYFAAKVLFNDKVTGVDYFALGLILALGHLTKQMMMLQVIIIILCAIFINRHQLKSVAFWSALLLSFSSLIPPILWNAQNEWITFQHTGHHFESASPELGKSLSRLGELIGALIGLVSPLIFLTLFPAIGTSLKQLPANIKKNENKASTFFFFFGALGLLVMLSMVFRQRVNPNWPAVFLLGGIGLSLLWVFQSDKRQKFFKTGIKVAATLSAILMVILPLLEPLSLPLAKLGLKPQRRGWQGYPTLVKQSYDAIPHNTSQIVFVGHRFTASQFAFYGKQNATNETPLKSVHLWNSSDYIKNQFDFFPSPVLDQPIAIVVEQKKESSTDEIPPELIDIIQDIEVLTAFPIHKAREYPRYKIYLAKKVLKWPISPSKRSQ